MEYKKTIILLALVVFLLSIAGVSASEIDDTLASENANTIELSTDNDIKDNLQTSEENEALASTDYDEVLSAQTDTEVLGADSATYFDLAEEIRHSGNITLTHKNYTYDGGEPITISEANKVIDGNGAVIDMNGSTIRAFTVTASGVTIKNLTIKNANYDGHGGAIYFDSTGTVTNCNFTDNTASGDGGAVYFNSNGTVTNCNFVDNKAAVDYNSCGGAVYFNSNGEVTNCNFTGNKATGDEGCGGAVFFFSNGTVTNCNFVDNKATEDYSHSGAVFFEKYGNVTNCNFAGNTAVCGGAISIGSGTVSNCNFTNNKADYGGAVFFYDVGTVSNCNFVENSALSGGAIFSMEEYTTADTCIFKTDSDTTFNTHNIPPTLNVNNFTTFYNSGEKLTFDLKTNSSIPVTNGNISISVYFKDGDLVGNYSCLSGEGWIPDLPVGSYIVFFDTEYAEFQKINRTLKISDGTTFWDLNQTINADTQSEINLINNYTFNPDYDADFVDGIVINRSVTINGNGFTINAKGKARIFEVLSDNVVLKNIIFKNGNITGDGGAVHFGGSGTVENCNFTDNSAYRGGAVYLSSTGNVTNCNFADNTATYDGAVYFVNTGNVTNCDFTNNTSTGDGGAIRFMSTGTVTNCNFTDNSAQYGGAVRMGGGDVTDCNFINNSAANYGGAILMASGTVSKCNFINNTAEDGGAIRFNGVGTVTNCNFTDNNATTGSAIYFYSKSATKTVSNSRFLNNRANAEALEITKNDNNITITFTGRNNLLNAIYSRNDAEVTFNNVTYWGANGITTVSATMSGSNKVAGQNITVKGVVNGKIIDKINGTDENGEIVLDDTGDYWIIVSHKGDLYYTEIAETLFTNMKLYANVTSLTTNNKTVNITAKSNIFSEVMPGKLLFILQNGTQIEATYGANGTWWAMHKFADYSVYQVNATYEGLDNVTITNGTISISKTPTNITVENETLELFVKDSIATGATLTPAYAGNVTYTVSNSSVVEVKDGIIKAVGEGSAIITVSFAGSDDYAAADNKTISVTVSLKNASVSVNNATLDLLIGDEFIIVATTDPKGLDVTFTPDNSGVISVDDSGVVTALREGNATVKVKVGGDGVYALNTTDVTVTVKKIPTNITVKNATLELYVEDSIATGVTLTPADAGNVTYTVSNSSVVKVEDGTITAIGGGTAIITVSFAGNDNYTAAENKTITVNVIKYDSKVTISPINDTVYPNNVTIKYAIENRTNVIVSIDGVSDDKISITDDAITVVGIDAGVYTLTVINSESSMYYKSNDTKTFTVNKQATSIAAADVSTTYNINKDLVITLKDANGNPLTGASVTVDLNGAKTYTTVKNGQVKVSTKGIAPKAYTAKVTFNGNTNYDKSTKDIKVTVKKATPKLTAKKKTYKTTPKTKKYTIVLKDNTGKAIKKAKVTLKVKGKTYKATTNSKGKATFKITKLNKKGTFKATITYKGNKYYNKVSKKAKIKVIVKFKTVSKGSKDKSTVKEIQQALKDKGYYLTYQGHYLKVDGKFKGCTERSLKEFQKDNGLKVTGKVDEKTAKKLGIL